ncbi:MAG: poly(R)-hydroxyalkanoic acid synthase subunit PhaE [Desulfobacterales bacterium]|jgi:class III poly(R)-hydroxyalkanoic acid synthase PhaE subunit
MDTGADLFFQMLKGLYPGYAETGPEKYQEWFQKAGQNFFGDRSAEATGKDATALFRSWMEGVQEALAKGTSADDFEIQNKILQNIIQNGHLYIEFMNTVSEAARATYAGDATEAMLHEVTNKLTQHYLNLYQANIGKFVGVPQFGIHREAQAQIMSAIDSYHRFMGAVGDFLVKFGMPLKEAMDILQQAIKDREAAGEDFKSAKEIYDFAVNILEKRYDDYIKSPEGVQNVVDLVEKYLAYKKKQNIARDIRFRSLSIPTRKEMEDVYKGIYDLKKRTRKQDALIRKQNKKIKALKRKLQNVESALSRKKSSAKSVGKRRAESKAATKGSKKAKSSKKTR